MSDSFMLCWDNPTERVNAEYIADITAYSNSPISPCSKAKALKLLNQFARKDFPTFWTEPITEYLPAVSEGTMKLSPNVQPHADAVAYAKTLISEFDPTDLAKAFLYGVARNAPEYRTALACYYFIKNLPDHAFEPKYCGTNHIGDVYSESKCEICNYNSKLSDEPKMQFWHINVYMYHFYIMAHIPFNFNLNIAITFLEEYQKLPAPNYSPDDLSFFQQVIAYIEALPDNTPPSQLRKALKESGLLKMNTYQIDAFIDMLGYLNILHTNDSFGVTAGHTPEKDMQYPLSDRSYFAHPVNRWTRKHGIDYDAIDFLFGKL